MGESTNTEKTVKKSWSKGLKSEFKKITWPDKSTLAKQSVAVVVVSVFLGLVISLLDAALKFGIDKIIV